MNQSVSGTAQATLPVELTHFVGRERELAALRHLAGTARLVTLTGAGGSGKSRLALELFAQPVEAPGDGVVWVELAPLMEEHLVPGAILAALGAPAEGVAATAQAIIATIGDRTLTIVLDNCEHLVDTCAPLADTLLRHCAGLRIIATSREALGIAGERAWLVPPLTLPPLDARLADVAASDAVQLFIERARDVLPTFALTETNAAVVSAICARVDGIPLAIELAAARVRHLSPEQILARLSDAFALLTTGARTALPRHRTLRATLDWSHDLLPEDARTVLRRLGVFRGGFTLDLAEQTASGHGIGPADVLDLIGALADRSMIIVREHGDTARYHLLETMRQYALLRLAEAGETERVRARFATALIAQVAEVEPLFTTRSRRTAFAGLEAELDNLREVLAWTREHDHAQHVRLVGMLWWFWFTTRHWVEAHQWITGALELPVAAQPTRDRAALLFAAGALGALRVQIATARPMLEEAAALAAQHGDARLEAYALNYIGMTYSSSLSPEAREYTARAARWLRANNDEYGLRLALLLGGMAEYGSGDVRAASRMMEEAVEIARSFGQDRELAVALQTYATVLLGSGEHTMVHGMVRESLEALRRDPSFLFIARAIDLFAHGLVDAEPERAASAIGIALTMRMHIGANRFEHDEVLMNGVIAKLREKLGDSAYDKALAGGTRVQPADAIDAVIGADGTEDVAAAPPSSGAHVTHTVEDHARKQPVEQAAAADSDHTGGVSPAGDGSQADLTVRALGPLDVSVRGRRVEVWPYAKPKELLAYLLMHPQGRTRAEIGAELWPGASPAQVRNSFHVTVHHVRKTLGHADWLVLSGERYMIAQDVSLDLDVTAFQKQVREALSMTGPAAISALRSAIALYRDHFLAGEQAGPWRDEVQDRLRVRFCDAGLRLGELLTDAGDLAGASAAYERVIACEPLHEAAHRGLLLTLTRTGRRAHALRHYERLLTVLNELELAPEVETVELVERIRAADIAIEPGRSESVPGPQVVP